MVLFTNVGFSAILRDDISDPDLLDELTNTNYKEVTNYLYLTFTNLTLPLTSGRNYAVDTGLIYFVSNNNNVDVPFTFQTFYKDNNDDLQAVFKDITIPASSTVSFWTAPTRDGEYMSTYIRCLGEQVNVSGFDGATCGAGYQVREKLYTESPLGVSSTFAPLILGVTDLISINISIWKIVYYLFIMLIVLSALGGLILIGKKYYEYTTSHDIFRKHNSRK